MLPDFLKVETNVENLVYSDRKFKVHNNCMLRIQKENVTAKLMIIGY